MRTLNVVAWGLLIVAIVIPTVLLGLYVAPWFFTMLVLLAVVPLLMMRQRE